MYTITHTKPTRSQPKKAIGEESTLVENKIVEEQVPPPKKEIIQTKPIDDTKLEIKSDGVAKKERLKVDDVSIVSKIDRGVFSHNVTSIEPIIEKNEYKDTTVYHEDDDISRVEHNKVKKSSFRDPEIPSLKNDVLMHPEFKRSYVSADSRPITDVKNTTEIYSNEVVPVVAIKHDKSPKIEPTISEIEKNKQIIQPKVEPDNTSFTPSDEIKQKVIPMKTIAPEPIVETVAIEPKTIAYLDNYFGNDVTSIVDAILNNTINFEEYPINKQIIGFDIIRGEEGIINKTRDNNFTLSTPNPKATAYLLDTILTISSSKGYKTHRLTEMFIDMVKMSDDITKWLELLKDLWFELKKQGKL